jgi:hypothetical protein
MSHQVVKESLSAIAGANANKSTYNSLL